MFVENIFCEEEGIGFAKINEKLEDFIENINFQFSNFLNFRYIIEDSKKQIEFFFMD